MPLLQSSQEPPRHNLSEVSGNNGHQGPGGRVELFGTGLQHPREVNGRLAAWPIFSNHEASFRVSCPTPNLNVAKECREQGRQVCNFLCTCADAEVSQIRGEDGARIELYPRNRDCPERFDVEPTQGKV